MSQKFGYLVDVCDIKLDETTNQSWIQAMPAGKYNHPLYGEIDINSARTQQFADNVKNNVRGQELDIDYDHKEKENIAAGWVKAAESRQDGALYLLVEWTPRAAAHIKAKEYKYFSPEFVDEWTHPATNKTYSDVLFGGGLTNRPFLKGIMPVNLSEFFTEPDEGSKSMKPEQKTALIAKYGLGADATDDQVLDAAANAELKPPTQNDPPENAQLAELTRQISELKKLSDTNPAVASMLTVMEAQQSTLKALSDTVANQQIALHLSEMAGIVKSLDEKANAKGYGIPKPVVEAATTFLSEHSKSKKFSDDFSSLMNGLLDAKLIQLGEARKGGDAGGTNDVIKSFNEKASKLAKDEKMSFADAVEQVANENPDLYAEYRRETANVGGDN